MAHGAQARNRRRARRAAGLKKADALIAAAVGGNFPLGDRAEGWDSGAAEKGYSLPADANHYMFKDGQGDPEAKSSYKLPFVSGDHAVWKAITAIAAVLQGGRGGVDIPPADVASIKGKVGAYYAKARTKYKDDSIQPPWKSNAKSAAEIMAAFGFTVVDAAAIDDLAIWSAALANAEVERVDEEATPLKGHKDADFAARYAFWMEQFGSEWAIDEAFAAISRTFADGPMSGECADESCGHMANMHGGEMNDGACSAEGCMCEGFQVSDGPDKEPDDDVDDYNLVVKAGTQEQFLAETLEAAADIAKDMGQSLTFVLSDFVALTADGEVAEQPIFTGGARWVANFCPEGKATEDGRIFAPGSITWRELPLTLMGMIETQPGHDGAEVCGRIDNVWRDEGANMIRASGIFESDEFGQKIATLVGNQTLRGLSVDIAPVKVEVAKRADVVDENGLWIEQAFETDEDAAVDEEPPSLVDLLFGDDDMITVVREGVIGAATVCPFPAFAEANIEIEKSLVAREQNPMVWTVTSQAGWVVVAAKGEQPEPEPVEEALTASAAGIAPVKPPAEWFEDPMLEALSPLSVDEDGRISGHAAAWGTCHTGIPGQCTTAPTSETGYAYFHLKEVLCEGGQSIPVGTITMDGPHAEIDLGRAAATDHYDNTCVSVADVRVGEDDHGIWVAGALRPDIDEVTARRLRGASLSGDWRSVRLSDGTANREMIALLAVNVPGFPIPRPAALVASIDGRLEVVAQVGAGQHAGQEGLSLLEARQMEADAMSEEFAALAASAAPVE